jgi:hypothetical protein
VRLWKRRQRTRRPPPYEVPGTGVTDLAQMIFGLYHALPPPLREHAVWVMDPHWLRHCYAFAGTTGQAAPDPEASPVLVGRPVVVTENGGWPHLEPARRAA